MKTVLITGTNKGIGLEFTRQYLQDGYAVIATCRNPDQAQDLQALAVHYPDTLTIYHRNILLWNSTIFK